MKLISFKLESLKLDSFQLSWRILIEVGKRSVTDFYTNNYQNDASATANLDLSPL